MSQTTASTGVPENNKVKCQFEIKTPEEENSKMTLGICLQRAVLFGVGGVFFVVGVLMASLWPLIFNSLLKTQLSLTPNSKTFEMWSETPIPMYIDIYLFNWTNPEETLKEGKKPIMKEVGPFVFSEHRSKVNVKWNNNKTVTYQNRHRWNFHPELTEGSLQTKITNLNVVLMTIGAKCKKLSTIEKMAIDLILKFEAPVVITKTVQELLFDGYDDTVLKLLNILHSKYPKYFPETMDKFGWFYKRNMSDTADGIFEMETGLNDLTAMGNVLKWNGKNKLNFYSGECSKITGSLGELWAPRSYSKDHVTLFASDMCSALKLPAAGDYHNFNLTGTTFAGGEAIFDNGSLHPESACYCIKNTQGVCPASGVRDVSPCRGGAPAFMSYPHFYLADPSYRSAVEGMNPDSNIHTFRITLEETTGIPMKVNARMQINILMQPIAGMKMFSELPKIYMPMLWFNQHTEMTPEIANSVMPLVQLAKYGPWVLVGLAVFGFLLIATGLFFRIRRQRQEDDARETLLEQ